MTSLWRHKLTWNYISWSNYVLSFKVLWTLQLWFLLWTSLIRKKKKKKKKNEQYQGGVRATALEHLTKKHEQYQGGVRAVARTPNNKGMISWTTKSKYVVSTLFYDKEP